MYLAPNEAKRDPSELDLEIVKVAMWVLGIDPGP